MRVQRAQPLRPKDLIVYVAHPSGEMRPVRHYIDQIEAHLPFKPSKWERKYQILALCLAGLFLIMTIVAFALHDQALVPY